MSTNRPDSDIAVIARFDGPAEVARWSAFDDVVMGGVSASRMTFDAGGHGTFTGEVSLENNGGFASVRSNSRDWGLAGARGLVLRVRGDGHTYKVNARTNDGFDGGSWQCAFPTTRDAWTTVRIAFADFVPRLRGRTTDAGPLPPAEVRTLGLLITDKQAGPFRLDVEWIGVWR
ncbi:MAG: CIA30 family protein [Planctomycetota bacterium]|nr:CIA30 family protein [Planctomycetota bacterium]